MRYCLAALMLFAVLPVMNVLAAPVPAPWAVLDIGPPPKGQTADDYCSEEIGHLTKGMVGWVYNDPQVKNLPSVAPLKNPFGWLSTNLRVKPENGGRHLRLSFRAGSRAEQEAILDTFLRVYLRFKRERIKGLEEGLRIQEEGEPRLTKMIEETQNPR